MYRNALGVLSKAVDKVQRDGLQGSMADAEVSTDNITDAFKWNRMSWAQKDDMTTISSHARQDNAVREKLPCLAVFKSVEIVRNLGHPLCRLEIRSCCLGVDELRVYCIGCMP